VRALSRRVALVPVLVLTLAAPAHASTAEIVFGSTGDPSPVVTYSGAPGEANRLTVATDGEALVLTDPAVTVTAKAPCVSIDAHTASCDSGRRPFGYDGLTVRLGDGDDSVTIATGLGAVTVLDGGAGDDVLSGAQESDIFHPGPGSDRVDGGAGDDWLDFSSRRHGVTVDIAAGRTSGADSFASIKTVRGGAGPDRLLGGSGRDLLFGGAGDDVLSGRGGKDVLYGDLGADRLEGGGGHDYLSGDRRPGDGPDAPPRVRPYPDVLLGGRGDDVLLDPGGANRLSGGPGADVLFGGAGPDRVFGGPGDDDLRGRRGADRLSGGTGRDYLDGGSGVDRLFGGGGNDKLQARDHSADRADCGHGRDQAVVDAKDLVHACEVVRGRGYTGPR
jgi:Ca2+-binding RTX toxin-like protein